MSSSSVHTLKWIMRAGYGARAAIYLVVGGLAFKAALWSGQAEGTKGALAELRATPLGVIALWAIGIGLFAYMVWRIVAGIADVEDHGHDAKGITARGGQITTGIIHGIIGLSVIGLAMGGAGTDDSAQDWTQKIMQMPMGRWLIGAAAAVIAGAGIYYAYKGWSGKYKEHLAASDFTTQVDPVLTAGLVIYGALLALVATSIGFAAFNADPGQAGGLGAALTELRGMTYGRLLMGAAGLGLVAFAFYNFVEAAYRVVPKLSSPDVETLAAKLKSVT
ncbi:putative membrane protein [Sulfitobacter noctilucae]|uniref:DUF1206 domain-containing protein n=1 Tax=Sulfitobacter noctilucae TaxID=1342302 RepID=UPI00046AB5E3|nr:DUF1206 domain-containing protein [Sulfitobacter noctilucae]KIN61539.1 putative membrane protein [Sulfitobacter noctilucae]